MDDLNQTQVVLLCLLTSFVTSIGTGIITVTLLNEAPQTVTQTINRVVERTVETIVPEPSSPNVITKEVTVVVKEEDLVIDAIGKSRNSLVRIVRNSTREAASQSVGVIITKSGTILADKRFVTSAGSYSAIPFSGGTGYPVTISKVSSDTNAVFLVPANDVPAKTYTPVTLASSDSIQLGQTVIAMGGKDKEAVAIGRISSVNQIDAETPAGTTRSTSTPLAKVVVSVETDAPLRDAFPGSILLNLNGSVVGFENFDVRQGIETLYYSIGAIRRSDPTLFENP